jgi:hypothetical protein
LINLLDLRDAGESAKDSVNDNTKKPGRAKKPSKKKKAADSNAPAPILDEETMRTQRRVAQLRDKLRNALDDPEKRKQMVEAIRSMMRDE